MTRFDDLTKLFDPWRTEWLEQYRQHQRLPFRIAKLFQEFLGCPETFSELSLGGSASEKERYVSATDAQWDEHNQQFILKVTNNPNADVEFHKDGFFYFGLRVLLEHGPNIHPKHPFWFLLRAQFDGSGFAVWVVQSKKRFELDSDLDALCEHLFDLLKENLSKSPMIQDTQDGYKIGFTAQ